MTNKNTFTTNMQRHNEKSKFSENFHDVEVVPPTLDASISNVVKQLKISKANMYMGKIVGSIMTIIFSLVAFAHGQDCTLLPGWSPNILADGQSRTGYQISEATFTQSCTGAAGLITCIGGSVANGNIFKYPSCTPHTWANCTTPTEANHLEYKTLYKLGTATFTQTCQQLSQSLQCLNGNFTGGITPWLYTFASCFDPNRAQCVNTWTNSFMDHGESVIGYTAISPGIGQTCTTLQKTLTCTNSFWSGNGTLGQAGLFTGCTNPGAFSGCLNIRTNTLVPHNSSLTAYSSPTGICSSLLQPLTCINGLRSGGNQGSLYSGCIEANTASCPNIITGTGFLFHGSFITMYTNNLAFTVNNEYCSNLAKVLQCNNGIRSGLVGGLFTGCQNVSSGSCRDPHTSKRIQPFGTIYRYTNNQPTPTQTCSNLRQTLTCSNGSRTGGNINNSPTCGNCILPRGTILPEGQITYGYSTFLWSVTGQNYIPGNCSPFSGQMTCINSILQGTGNGGGYLPSNFPYSLNQCLTLGAPKNCTNQRLGGTINHEQTITGYSVSSAEFPKTCDQNYSTQLTCINGSINGNWQTYQYSGCQDIGGPVPGIDLAINESPGLPGQENISGGIIAQGSSPEISILFKNKGDTPAILSNIAGGFLECTWTQQNINIYKSNIISNFVVNPGTKVGVNIRIKSLFTQSLGNKTIICKINPTVGGGYTDVEFANNTWSGTFEVVQTDRFDLALSKSIESISKNLEAAEGAKGAQGVQNFLYNKIMNVLLPLVIIIGILSAILGFYKIMFSSEDSATKEGTKYIIYGVIGIILIMSAKFIGQNVFDMLATGDIQGGNIAISLYNDIIYPFIKFAIYLVLGAMFIILVTRVITFLFGSDTDAQKKAGTLIGRNVISMIVIIGAKQIVEAIYGKQSAVTNINATNLGEIGSGILADKNIPILYQIINYALGIASLVILVIIIIQTVKLLMKPDDPAQIKSIKNSLLYMFIGILVLGAGYLIVNFAIIN